MSAAAELHDALVIGGGPTGATAALALRREGLSAVLVDRAVFPRFHVGESLLPRNMRLIGELGLEERLAALPQVAKHGAEFGLGDGTEIASIVFDRGLAPGEVGAFNIERAPFDAMLLRAAREAGAEVVEGAAVRSVLRLADGEVAVALEDGRTLRGRWLIDASGQGTVVGRHLGVRRVLPRLKKVAYFGHFAGVWRRPGIEGGFISIVMCGEGWFWLIPIDAALRRGRARPEAVRRRYVDFVRGSSEPLFRLVHHYYDPAFRDLFLDGRGPLGVHRAIISVLAGHVFPRPIAAVRWRLRLLDLMVALHRRRAITRRRSGFSLLAASPPS